MSCCEKCWSDAGNRYKAYARILDERKDNPCTPEQQAGPDATECPRCKRRTCHQYTNECMACHITPGDGIAWLTA